MKDQLNPPAAVRQAEDLESLAKRINAREKKSRKDAVQHARQQGEDLLAAKERCGHGEWMKWCRDNLSIKRTQINCYITFAKLPAAGNSEDELWEQWQKVQGHDQDEEAPPPEPDFTGPRQAGGTGWKEETATTAEVEDEDEPEEDADDDDVGGPAEDEDEGESDDQDEAEGPAPAPPRKGKTKRELEKRITWLKARGCESPSSGDTVTLAELNPEVGDLTLYELRKLFSLWEGQIFANWRP
jgi:hypothetical protein